MLTTECGARDMKLHSLPARNLEKRQHLLSSKVRSALRSLAVVAITVPLAAHAQTSGSLTIKEQGSFFVGGENRTVSQPAAGVIPAQSGEITVNQMYVQYQIPLQGAGHVPVVFVH